MSAYIVIIIAILHCISIFLSIRLVLPSAALYSSSSSRSSSSAV